MLNLYQVCFQFPFLLPFLWCRTNHKKWVTLNPSQIGYHEAYQYKGDSYTFACYLGKELPIEIERSKNGHKSWIRLRRLNEKDAQALFSLLEGSPVHDVKMLRFMPSIVKRFGSTLIKTRQELSFQECTLPPSNFKLGIFFRATSKAPWRLVGQVGSHSWCCFDKQRRSIETSNWITKVYRGKGIATDAEKALIHYLFTYHFPMIKLVARVVEKSNLESQRMGPKLGMCKTKRPHDDWCYDLKKEITTTWILPQKKWHNSYLKQ